MRRSIWFWLCFVCAIIMAIYFASRITMTFMGYGPATMVRTISVRADTRDKDLGPVAAAAGVIPGTHTYAIDLDSVAGRIAAVPGVREYSVRRLPSGNLVIRVKMYQAVALWGDGDAYYPLSADGTVVNRPDEERNPSAILFRGKLPGDISEITKLAHNFTGRLDYLEWIENRRWNMHMIDGVVIMLPEDDPAAAIGTLLTLDKNHKILSRDVQIIDMRDSARILVK